jgi:hypothetical protein
MWRLRKEIYSTEIFRNSLKLLRILPVPSTTLHNGSAAMHTGSPVSGRKMTDGRGSVKACRSQSRAVVSKMPRTTWQLNYKCISKESCASILREERGELLERATFRERHYVRTL